MGRLTSKRRRKRWLLLLLVLPLCVIRPTIDHLRAFRLLAIFADVKADAPVDETGFTFEVPGPGGASRTVAARLYLPPNGGGAAPGLVMVHGIHRKGIDEPRLVRFARALAGAGVVVMTPAVAELSDYHVAPASTETVGAAMKALEARLGAQKVGLMGMSFGGGVALLAAADARFADDAGYVVAIGAHDSLARVSRFFATNEISGPLAGPSSDSPKIKAHEYGATVLVYSNAEDFFPAADVPGAREALKDWLWEEHDAARDAEKSLSPLSRGKIDRLFAADIAPLRAELLREVDGRQGEMAQVSPHDHLGGLRAHVYLLHGAGDTVIPATETLWLARDTPASTLREILISPAIQHVEMKEPRLIDKWRLVHFMAQILAEARQTALQR